MPEIDILFVAFHQTAKPGSPAPFLKFSASKYLYKKVYFITWHDIRAFWKINNIGIVYDEMSDAAS